MRVLELVKMPQAIVVTFILLVSAVNMGAAQKVKYKDLYILLSSNNFEQAEPFLRRFIVQENDHPNATLYMGRLMEYKLDQKDILKETADYLAYADSAITYYKSAAALITEKETKKNEDYYQDYSRRDLRTGKFGVKHADVQFDLEKKIESLENRIKNLETVKDQFDKSARSYNEAMETYNNIASQFSSERLFLFKSDNSYLDTLKLISGRYVDFLNTFEGFKSALENFGRTTYNQNLETHEITELNPVEAPDYYSHEIVVYNFQNWCENMKELIESEIIPLRGGLTEYDRKLELLHTNAFKDSLVIDPTSLSSDFSFDKILKYDENPLPQMLFGFKRSEIEYWSYVNQSTRMGSLDSTDVDFRIELFQQIALKYSPVVSGINELNTVDIESKSELYSDFFAERYGGMDGLRHYIDDKSAEVETVSTRLTEKISSLKKLASMAVAGMDTLSIVRSDSLILSTESSSYVYNTLAVDTLSNGFLLGGVKVSPELIENFTATVGKDRIVDTLHLSAFSSSISKELIHKLESWIEPYESNESELAGLFQVVGVSDTTRTTYQLMHVKPEIGLEWSKEFETAPEVLVKDITVDPGTSLVVITLHADGEIGEGHTMVYNFKGSKLSAN